jgi:hypothetical protein
MRENKQLVDKSGKVATWEDRDEFEISDAAENEEDLSVSTDEFEKLVIAPSDWTVGTIYTLIGKQLHLDPDYQRRNVWPAKAKSKFIESLILGIPIPQILLASKAGQKNSFLVLDGKQRLTTIKEFMDGRHLDGRKFKLRGLRILSKLEGMDWNELQKDATWGDRLANEPIRTTILRGWEKEAVLYEIFYRLNSGSVQLSPMELRMALYPGPFLKFIIRWSEDIGPLHHLLKKNRPDARMGDVELAVRHLAFTDGSIEYRGDLKNFLDTSCELYNEEFSEPEFLFRLNEMNAAIECGLEIFGDRNFCRKYEDGSFETRFNRAIFDVLVGSLAHGDVRNWANAHQAEFMNLYKATCDDIEFIRAIESTTKSPSATRKRFSIWYSAVENATGLKLHIPPIRA